MAKKHRFDELVEIMARLRGPDGCLWDKEQTHQTLKPYMIEEAYEVIEAIDMGDDEHLKEELGDLLLQVVFHARIGSEQGRFTIEDVLSSISEKLIRRHPHVFEGVEVSSSREVIERWEKIKKGEKEERTSRLDGIPGSLPSLYHAYKLQKKMAGVGFDWPDKESAIKAYRRELEEFEEALEGKGDLADELGDILFMIVNLARHYGLEPETRLKEAIHKFETRFRHMEDSAEQSGKVFEELSLDEMDALWDEAKAQEVKDEDG